MTDAAGTPGRRAAAAAVWALAAASVLFLLTVRAPFNLGDEGFRFLLARSWAQGDDLFERFRLLYLPGEHAAFGLLMRLGGETLATLRLGNALLAGAAVGVLYAAIRPRAGRLLAVALAIAAGLAASPVPKLLAMAAVFAAALRLADREPPGGRWVLGVASLAGVLAAVREDSAALALAVAVLAVARRRRWRELATRVVPGLLLGLLPWLALAAARGETGALLAHAGHRFAFLATRLGQPTEVAWSSAERWPRSPLEAGLLAQPLLAVLPPLVYFGILAREGLRRRRREAVDRVAVAAALAGLTYLPQYLWERPDLAHYLHHQPVMLAAFAAAAASAPRRLRLAAAALLVTIGAIALGARVGQAALTPRTPYPTPEARAIGATLASDLPPWSGLPREPGETLIVLSWGPGWYVLEGLEPGTRHLSTFQRHLRTPESRAELLRDLRRPANRWVLVPRRPEASPEALAVVEEVYRRRAEWRRWELWERRADTPGGRLERALDEGLEVRIWYVGLASPELHPLERPPPET